MLKLEDHVSVDWRKNSNGGRYRIYIFKCNNCFEPKVKSRKCYFYKHSGICQSCSAKKTIYRAIAVNRLRPHESRYNNFKAKCPETNITYEEYLEFTKVDKCTYCEDTIPWTRTGNTYGFYLDRKDNKLGHIRGNLTVCCGLCNKTKRNVFTYDEFMLLGPGLKQIRELRKKNE